MDCSPPGFSVHGISQARILELVAISFSKGFFQPMDQTHISSYAGGFFTTEAREAQKNSEEYLEAEGEYQRKDKF